MAKEGVLPRRRLRGWLWALSLALAAVAAVALAHGALEEASGVGVLALVTVQVAAIVLLLGLLWGRGRGLPRGWSRALLAIVSGALAIFAAELVLGSLQKKAPPKLKPKMPPELARRFVDGPTTGPMRDYHWMGVLHSHNSKGFRDREHGPRREGALRIAVLGDSLVYGQGIAAEARFSALLERTLSRRGAAVEVLNLGMRGYESEDLLRLAREHLPGLDVDLVLYGHCFNDFLPSGRGQYRNNMRWQVPLPEVEKTALTERTLLGELIARRYDDLLLALDIRRSFYGDILAGFEGHADRFAEDMKALGGFVEGLGLPPVAALVLTQEPKNRFVPQLRHVAEAIFRDAGMTVVPAEYIDRYADKKRSQLVVSKWDGHPNEWANQYFAEAFLDYFGSDEGRRLLAAYEP